MTTLDLPVAMPALAEGVVLTIQSNVATVPAITLTDVAGLNAGLRACQAAQLAEWGMDPAETARIATPAEPGAAGVTRWFSSDNYPKQAMKERREGVVIFRWTIGIDGGTRYCAAVQSSGSADLDAAACAVILRHRYTQPARDAAGAAMVSHGLRRLVWRLPGR